MYDLTPRITTRGSVNSSGAQGNGSLDELSLSTDDVAFESSSNLVVGDTNNTVDVLVAGALTLNNATYRTSVNGEAVS